MNKPSSSSQLQQKPTKKESQPPQINFDPKDFVKPGLNEEDVIKLKEIFDTFDTEKSGQVSPEDLKKAIVDLNMEGQAQKIILVLNDLYNDSDQNQQTAIKITFGEFLQVFGFTTDINEETSMAELFKYFDQDEDGLIKLEDFQRITELVGERYSQTELREMIEHADKDKDGFINFEEFKAVVTKEYPAI